MSVHDARFLGDCALMHGRSHERDRPTDCSARVRTKPIMHRVGEEPDSEPSADRSVAEGRGSSMVFEDSRGIGYVSLTRTAFS